MNNGYLQSALRELHGFFVSSRFWLTIVIVALLFAIVGPFGTHAMPLIRRAAFWVLLHASAFSTASVVVVFTDLMLSGIIRHRLLRMMLGAILSAVPIGLVVEVLQAGFTDGAMSIESALHQMQIALMLSPLLCILTYMTMSSPIGTKGDAAVALADIASPTSADNTDQYQVRETSQNNGPAVPVAEAPPAILARLKPENRGRLLRLSVQDHYTEIVTSRGRELILLRFADALGELGTVAGQRIHRSHWVADEHVGSLKRDKGKLFVVTTSGVELPVSRPYEAEMRERFARRPASPDAGRIQAS